MNQFVRLKTQTPLWVFQNISYHLGRILAGTRLRKPARTNTQKRPALHKPPSLHPSVSTGRERSPSANKSPSQYRKAIPGYRWSRYRHIFRCGATHPPMPHLPTTQAPRLSESPYGKDISALRPESLHRTSPPRFHDGYRKIHNGGYTPKNERIQPVHPYGSLLPEGYRISH